nr:unnamed protein product [Callosobruchus chinensis]
MINYTTRHCKPRRI